jgi:RNA polymerase sigma factor (sigma-70 family)
VYFKQAESEKLERAGSEDLSPSQYHAAELGFFGLLRRKRMSREFIDRHGEDLFAQALFEYVRSIRAGKDIRKPVAWIVLCAWSRTIRVLEQPNWRPRMVSTESVAEISADATPAPEEELLSEDRYRQVREAVEHLPEYQRELLSLSYFEGMSVRDAARKLDWHPSKAQRAHEAAQRHLHRLLGVETSDELEIAAGLAAFLSFGPDGCDRIPQLVGGFEAVVDAIFHGLLHLGERGLELLRRPFSHGGPNDPTTTTERAGGLGDLGRRTVAGAHHGPTALAGRAGRRVSDLARRIYTSGGVETSAAAADGGARVAEACKAIAAVCVIGGGAIAGGSALLGPDQHHRAAPPQRPKVMSSRQRPTESRASGATWADPTPASTSAVVPTGPEERAPKTGGSRSTSASAEPAAKSKTVQRTGAETQAEHHQTEESTAESTFEAGQIAAAEEEERRSSPAPTDTGPTLSDSGGAAGTGTTETKSPRLQAEERQAKTQFQGGLP